MALPFWMYPFSWGLKGKDREIAKAKYELSGYDLDNKLVEIEFDQPSLDKRERVNEVKKKHDRISEYDYQKEKITIAAMKKSGDQYESDKSYLLDILELNRSYKKIETNEYEKTRCNILEEPWVIVLKAEINKENPAKGFFELDWNDYFVRMLEKNGFKGLSDDQIVNQWFETVCTNVALESGFIDEFIREGGEMDNVIPIDTQSTKAK